MIWLYIKPTLIVLNQYDTEVVPLVEKKNNLNDTKYN